MRKLNEIYYERQWKAEEGRACMYVCMYVRVCMCMCVRSPVYINTNEYLIHGGEAKGESGRG